MIFHKESKDKRYSQYDFVITGLGQTAEEALQDAKDQLPFNPQKQSNKYKKYHQYHRYCHCQ